MAKIKKEDIEKVAFLARLELNEVEIKKYQEQLSDVLNYIDTIQELGDLDMEVLGLTADNFNQCREDEVIEWDPQGLKLAKKQFIDQEDGQVKVNRVL